MMRSFMSRQFLGFLLTGGLAALVNFGSRILYNQWVDFSSAVVLAYLTGMVTAFILARSFVFTQSSQSVQRSAIFFVMVNGVAVLQTWAISMALYYLLPMAGVTRWVPEIAHAVGVVVPVFTSYLGHKRFSFK
ncbi:MAG: GtrA family protein [Burkholderiaceae bacterium]|jgi:putative flippase GtrA|nr:GtrA family protein [Burkholderiales bacterium]NCV84422.1 GtrA family protein [Oxalobacteraceae bacterium]